MSKEAFSEMSHEPFAADCVPLAGGVQLEHMTAAHAVAAAQGLAAMEPWLGLGYSAAGLAGYLTRADPCLRRFALLRGEQLAGVAAVRYPWLRGAYLELFALFGEAQGRGLGGEVMEWLVRETAPRERNLWVAVSAGNEGAHRFYLRHGFSLVGELPDLVREGFTELLLRRRLPPPA